MSGMLRQKIISVLEKFEENRKFNCDVVDLYKAYGHLSSKISSFAEKKKTLSQTHDNLMHLLNKPSKSLACYLDDKCPECVKVSMKWQISIVEESVLVAKTAGRMDMRKMSIYFQEFASKMVETDTFYSIQDYRNTKVSIPMEKSEQLAKTMKKIGFNKKFNLALVYSDQDMFFNYFENVCRDLDMNIKCFDVLEDALDYIVEIEKGE